jgi:hypothetical protein
MSPIEKIQAQMLAALAIAFIYVLWLLYTGRLMGLFDWLISFSRSI